LLVCLLLLLLLSRPGPLQEEVKWSLLLAVSLVVR